MSKIRLLLYLIITLYITYFSIFSVIRYRNMYANYFDMGIMHHVVYNSYKALQTGELDRFLEHTDPIGPNQVSRLAVHNDVILGFFSPFYFLYPSSEVLLVIQSVVLGLGALAVFKIADALLKTSKRDSFYSLIFAAVYLFYVPLQFTNRFDFHSVTLATTFLLFMFYFWLTKNYRWSFVFFILSLMTKEQIGLVTAFAGVYMLAPNTLLLLHSPLKFLKHAQEHKKNYYFSLSVILLSLLWVIASFLFIIPYFRGAEHFATERYQNIDYLNTLLRKSTWDYLWNLFAPVGFLSIFSPVVLIALPEFAINLLSQNANMRSIVFHYTAVITPFIFISAIYGFRNLLRAKTVLAHVGLAFMAVGTVWFSFTKSPLPYSLDKDIYVYKTQQNAEDAKEWAAKLSDENIPVSATGNVGTFLNSRRKFYYFSKYYDKADYVIIRPNEVFHYHDQKELIPVYQQLVRDPRYTLIEKRENFEVYKKI